MMFQSKINGVWTKFKQMPSGRLVIMDRKQRSPSVPFKGLRKKTFK